CLSFQLFICPHLCFHCYIFNFFFDFYIVKNFEEGRRKKEEGRILRCLSFQLFICLHLCFHCYIFNFFFDFYTAKNFEEGRRKKEEGRRKKEKYWVV
ncbi:MAG: hypothetical protein F6K39_16530, partial [Okeania sp. SIO3B3]|nr:hypothetical protein [Okeania sp. SIO3B3]